MIFCMKYILPLFLLALALPITTQAASSPLGMLIKGSSSSAVYFAYNEKRYVFPNEHVYKSWYDDFDEVIEIPDAELAALPLGGNVTYRPGTLIKIESDPRVYAVSRHGTTHWLTTEEVAIDLYGGDWNTKVFDVPVTSFLDYDEDEPIELGEELSYDASTAIKQLAQNMTERHAPILTVLENATSTQQAIIRLDAANSKNAKWSTIVEGTKRTDPILGICEYTWCELTIQYSGTVNYTGFTTVEGSEDLLQSNTITLTP